MSRRVSDVEKRRMLRMREDGHTLADIGRATGWSYMVVKYHVGGGYVGKVAVAPLREAFLRSEKTAADVARHLGWVDRGNADTARVRRTLGLLPDMNGRGERSWRRRTDAETAALIGEVVGVASWELKDAA